MIKIVGVPIREIAEEIGLSIVYSPEETEKALVTSNSVNKAGLCLAGFSDDFEPGGVYILGKEEMHYLRHMSAQERANTLDRFMELKPPMVVVTDYENKVLDVEAAAKKHSVSYAQTKETSPTVVLKMMKFLNAKLAPCTSVYGELMVIYGEGVIIKGPSKIGKSETAVELINRGHYLVADDVIEVKKVSSQKLVGSAPESIKNFIELRGVGIINAEKMFGMDAVKATSQIDFAIEMVEYGRQDFYSTNLEEKESMDILGIEVPLSKIPVQIGRSMATLVEVATMAAKQRKSGYDATKTLLKNIEDYWK